MKLSKLLPNESIECERQNGNEYDVERDRHVSCPTCGYISQGVDMRQIGLFVLVDQDFSIDRVNADFFQANALDIRRSSNGQENLK